MSLQVNGLDTVQIYSKPQINTTFKANPAVTTNTLERTPTTNTLVKPTQNKTKKTLLTLGAIVLVGIGIFAAAKAGKAHQQKKAIQEIEKKFADLQNDMPRVQKTFKEVFLREDLTEKEALEMLSRYKEVEKLGITGKKEEYIEAVFKEAKNNYGFEALPSELTIVNEPIMGDKRILGYTDPLGDIKIRSSIKHNEIIDIIHHEFRHVKQRKYAYILSPEKYIEASQPKNMNIPAEIFDIALGRIPNVSKIPEEHADFAKKSLESILSYTSVKNSVTGYLTQWSEQDARFAGESIAKLFGLMTK